MINRPDRVPIWASQLAANQFPPVCAMTGRPAETWRRFRFATAPDWAYALLLLICLGGIGFIAFAVTFTLIARRASGYLPLTRSSSRTAALALWIPIGLLIAWPVCWVLGISIASINGSWTGTVGGVLGLLGVLFLVAGLIGRLVIKPLMCPRAKVMETAPGQTDYLVELRNVHPAFVAAVQQMHLARAQQYAQYAPQPPYLPRPG